MPSWITGVIATFVLSTASAYVFLRLRCKGTGSPFGPHARWWAAIVIVITAAVSTGLGMAAVAAGNHLGPAYIGLILPSGLWLAKVSTQRIRQWRNSQWGKRLDTWLNFPLRRLDDGIGDDLEEWCEARVEAVAKMPHRTSEAAQYYYSQVVNRLKDRTVLRELRSWLGSIEHKNEIVRLIRLDTTTGRLQAALQNHSSTSSMHKYILDRPRLAARLESDAQNELHLLLASLYRLGYHKLLIYPARARLSAHIRRHRVP
jgi:hypothetical protein